MKKSILFLAICLPMLAQEPTAWPDSYLTRLQALALMETLHAELLITHSATLTLEGWCRDHHLAANASIVADADKRATKPPDAAQRERLQVGPDEEVHYRRVRLRCGERVLAEADNWYVPSRLTAEMNRVLDTTDAPFGKVVQPLLPYRQTIASKMLWSALPQGWEMGPPAAPAGRNLPIPLALFEHQAVLYTGAHLPFSEVDEVYERGLLAFPPPQSPAR